jgi:hypothetical protein
MLKTIFTRLIDSFERRWGYDATYMRHILRGSPASFAKFSVVSFLVDRKAAPAEALAAAGIVGTVAEDCGPCTQISIDMAAAGGARPEVLRAILAGDVPAMGEDAGLAYRFARASLARDLDAVEPLRDEVLRRWGDAGLVALSLALTTARMYPTVKYALGYGRSCSKVTVAGQDAPVAQLALAA